MIENRLTISACTRAFLLLFLTATLPVLPVSAQSTSSDSGASKAKSETTATDSASRQLLSENYETWLQAYEHETIQATFKAVATEVRFEPYTGIRRGAIGTAIAQSGNALDQSMLLAHLARQLGFQVRFAEGTLEPESQAVLLEGMFPPNMAPAPDSSLLDRYQVSLDKELNAQVARHYWVQILLNGEWYSLDPSFPRAIAGESYADVSQTWVVPPKDLYQSVTISHHVMNVDETVKVQGSVDVETAELGLAPIQLWIAGVPQIKAVEEKRRSRIGLLGATLAGADKEPEDQEEKPEIALGVKYTPQINYGDTKTSFNSYLVPITPGEQSIQEEWLEFTINTPDSEPRTVKRWIFRSDQQTVNPEHYRQYTISILPHQIPKSVVEHQLLGNENIPWQELESEANGENAVDALTDFHLLLSANIGLLTNLTLASQADNSSDVAAFEKGLVTVYGTPRIYLQNVVGKFDEEDMLINHSIDLRLDEIESYPFPGYPKSSAYWFQQARGLRQSTLERLVLERLLANEDVVSTSRVMRASIDEDNQLLVINQANRKQFETNEAYKQIDSRFIEETLAKGNVIVVPEKPVQINGKGRVGWWEVDNDSGRIIGVMESGEHQATAEVVLTSQKAWRDMHGFALGMISGANSTQMLIMANILAHGEITSEHIGQLEEFLETIVCSSCPSSSFGISGSYGTDCVEYIHIPIDVTTSSLPFCDGYSKGFECAVSMIFSNLRGDSAYADANVVAGSSFGFTNVCE